MSESNRFPLDFDALNKGDIISVQRLEEIFQAAEGDRDYSFKMLSLRQKIEMHFMNRTGACPTVKHETGVGLHILRDEEASPYAEHHFVKGMRTLGKAHRQLTGVDRGQLTDERRVHHDRALVVQGAYLASIDETRRRLYLPPSQRMNPGLPTEGPDAGQPPEETNSNEQPPDEGGDGSPDGSTTTT